MGCSKESGIAVRKRKFNSMLLGIKVFFNGSRLLLKPGIKRFVFIPLFINICLFSFGFWFGLQWFDKILDDILPAWLAWAEFLLLPLFTLSYFLIVFYLFALIANVIAAPFNGLLAERIEKYLLNNNNNQQKENTQKFLPTIIPSIASELNKLTYFIFRSIPLLLLFLIPGINIIAPIAWFIFSAWMLSLEYLDYPLSNHNIMFKNTRELVKEQRPTCLSFGAIISILTLIPIVNFFVMPIAVAGATLLYLDKFSKNTI